jgi:glycosyltransferase involved in cell wall biosynthesis
MKVYEKGLVSVIIPTYKRTDKLDRAIKSVLGQSYKKIELLLVNDNVPGDEYTLALMEKVNA